MEPPFAPVAVPLRHNMHNLRHARKLESQRCELGDRELRRQNEQLRRELGSLQEMYSRHISNTEIKCEQLLREKDDERTGWYKDRKIEMKKMQASLVIMHALFTGKRRRFEAQHELEKSNFARREEAFVDKVAELESKCQEEKRKCWEQLAAKIATCEEETRDMERQRHEAEERSKRLEEQLTELRSKHERVLVDLGARKTEIESLRKRLSESERQLDTKLRDSRVEALEIELRQTKKSMREENFKAVNSLQKELMDYVRFITQILPDDWGSDGSESRNKMSLETLKERLTSRRPSTLGAGPRPVGPPRKPGTPRLPGTPTPKSSKFVYADTVPPPFGGVAGGSRVGSPSPGSGRTWREQAWC